MFTPKSTVLQYYILYSRNPVELDAGDIEAGDGEEKSFSQFPLTRDYQSIKALVFGARESGARAPTMTLTKQHECGG